MLERHSNTMNNLGWEIIASRYPEEFEKLE